MTTSTLALPAVQDLLARKAFDADDADVRNNLGLMGLLDIYSHDGHYRLTATLEPEGEAERTPSWILEVEVVRLGDNREARCKVPGVSYRGSQPGNHLRKLLASGELQHYLHQAANA